MVLVDVLPSTFLVRHFIRLFRTFQTFKRLNRALTCTLWDVFSTYVFYTTASKHVTLFLKDGTFVAYIMGCSSALRVKTRTKAIITHTKYKFNCLIFLIN